MTIHEVLTVTSNTSGSAEELSFKLVFLYLLYYKLIQATLGYYII